VYEGANQQKGDGCSILRPSQLQLRQINPKYANHSVGGRYDAVLTASSHYDALKTTGQIFGYSISALNALFALQRMKSLLSKS